ncbi:MAG TPA: circadian clock protein KaiC [Streptosporangiaceae bacterium]|nr:circadian clock protein KaiC [Streptosporangiaceae bacterium]
MTQPGALERLPTGINGFDEVALGGLPLGRPALVTGTTGTGKTLFAVEFLAHGIGRFGQPGVFVTFEERPADIRRNFSSLGFPIEQWESEGKWAFVDAAADLMDEAPVAGSYDFGALVARIELAVSQVGAHRVSLDALDSIFTRYTETATIRHELHRIALSLANLGVTAVVTGERTEDYDGVSKHAVEEFVLDNVIILRNVLSRERRRRTIEIVKFRGAPHRTGEWLFTIDPQHGLTVIPLAFLSAPAMPASPLRVSSGNPELDQMCGGGFFKDAVVLLTGPNGAGKTLASLRFLQAGIAAGERGLAFTFDENREQVRRNAAGWGLDLDEAEESGKLRFVCDYPHVKSPEDQFLTIRHAIEDFAPGRLVIDTLSALERAAAPRVLLDFMIALGAVVRQRGITTLLTSTAAGWLGQQIAGLTDLVITIRYAERDGDIQRAIAVTQSRGAAHDSRVRQVTIDEHGMHIGEPVTDFVHILADGYTWPIPDGRGNQPGSEDLGPDG